MVNVDRVLVMDNGRALEYDHPFKLLVNNINDKRITNKKGYFAKLVKEAGPEQSQSIFGLTRKLYSERVIY